MWQKYTYLRRILRSGLGGMERLKRESSERLSDGTEKHDQHMLYMGRLDVEKLRFLLKNALCRFSELCLPPTRGVHF